MAKKRIKKNWISELKKLHNDDLDLVSKTKVDFGLPQTVHEFFTQQRKEEKTKIKEKEKEEKRKVIGSVQAPIQKYTSRQVGFINLSSYQKLKSLALYWDCSIPATMERLLTDAWVRIEATELFEESIKQKKVLVEVYKTQKTVKIKNKKAGCQQ